MMRKCFGPLHVVLSNIMSWLSGLRYVHPNYWEPRRFCGAAIAAPVVLLIVACATAPTAPADPAAQVAMRAKERWQAMIDGDLDKAYGFLSPATRKTVSLAQFKGKIKPGMWRSVDVKTVRCDQEVCEVLLNITYDFRAAKGVVTELRESWLLDQGNAWYVYQG